MISENSEKILNYLKANYGKEFSKQELAGALGISLSSVIGAMNSFVKKGYAETTRQEVIEDSPATETRKAKTHTVNYHRLTEAGLAYDPVAEERARVEAKEAEKARKAAEKAAKNG